MKTKRAQEVCVLQDDKHEISLFSRSTLQGSSHARQRANSARRRSLPTRFTELGLGIDPSRMCRILWLNTWTFQEQSSRMMIVIFPGRRMNCKDIPRHPFLLNNLFRAKQESKHMAEREAAMEKALHLMEVEEIISTSIPM